MRKDVSRKAPSRKSLDKSAYGGIINHPADLHGGKETGSTFKNQSLGSGNDRDGKLNRKFKSLPGPCPGKAFELSSPIDTEKIKTGFIGAGTVGTALAVRLRGKGYPVVAVASRSRSSADRLAESVPGCASYEDKQSVADHAELVFITTPDDAIGLVASELRWHAGQSVLHCSGADSLGVLQPAREAGAEVGGFHPLQTFASVKHAIENLPNSTFGLEADGRLLELLKQMATDLDGRWVQLRPGDKVLYHAAAVLACNYLVTLAKLATDLWKVFGVSTPEATAALMPLLRGTLNNLENVGLPGCLTGPIARGDLGTIRKHLDALEKSAPALLSTYLELGRQTIPIALDKGKIDRNQADEMLKLLA
ncbi:MAG: DUF2520 domain-containing protein [Dehalococcoidia bacterium]|nr:DUF2520 domain-containing protein [Dehalococcoidia bacterium]